MTTSIRGRYLSWLLVLFALPAAAPAQTTAATRAAPAAGRVAVLSGSVL